MEVDPSWVEECGYPLVNVYITMENHHFQWENQLSMAMFNSYVKLPEGKTMENTPAIFLGMVSR